MRIRNQSGFTLSEMSVVIFITGLMLAAAAMIATPIIRMTRQIGTDQKMENIARALDGYAAQSLRLPCPGSADSKSTDPSFGYEAGSGETGNIVPYDCGSDPVKWQGMVPFRTLNIPAEWIRDASGHLITYAISPGFSQDVSRADLPVHSRCRTAEWFMPGVIYEKDVNIPNSGTPAPNTLVPKAERKARFCCSGAMPSTDLAILDVARRPAVAVARQISPASYRQANVIFPDPYAPNTSIPQDDRATAPVYILVAHNHNNATPAEKENANGDRIFLSIPPQERTDKERSFDDIVLWRTQDMILASVGKSCSLP
jgi:prepilin-type N-terminal cleavage/methylation domain-containing protein